MRIIEVNNCGECPCNKYDNGGGHTEPYYQCSKYGMILIDEDVWMDMDNKIHKDCKLKPKVEPCTAAG